MVWSNDRSHMEYILYDTIAVHYPSEDIVQIHCYVYDRPVGLKVVHFHMNDQSV